MDKIKWLKQSIIYRYDSKENLFGLNYLKAIIGDTLVKPNEIIMSPNDCEIIFDKPMDIVLINGQSFIRPISEPIENNEGSNEIDFPKNENVEDKKEITYIVLADSNNIVIENKTDEVIEVKIKEEIYFKETYPDFAQEIKDYKIKIKPGLNTVAKYSENRIKEVTIDNLKYKLDSRPSVYFTTVNALKEFLEDIGLKVSNKTDEQLKTKIIEKSLYLKKRFGLMDIEINNFELYPAYKKVVHLYCLQELISFMFINNGSTAVDSTSGVAEKLNLTLGKFSTKDTDNLKKDSLFLPDVIKQKIYENEEDLRKSIHLESSRVERTGGRNGNNQIKGKVSSCFGNW